MTGDRPTSPGTGPGRRTRHEAWREHAADYDRLAAGCRNTEARQVLDHLSAVCAEMARATDPDARHQPHRAAVHPNDVVREATAQRWRIREAEYRAIADSCESQDGRRVWLVVAEGCATLAEQLDRS